MVAQKFYLLGESASSAREIELEDKADFEDLQHTIAAHFAIVAPKSRPF